MDLGPVVYPAFASTWRLPTSLELPTSLPLAPVIIFRRSTAFVAVQKTNQDLSLISETLRPQ